ncbi:uncharacterized protein LOC117168943 [Belonocnema kinseyi]|uniref:uncharacterized protein LOC117168943 n=1 Tax=Belonocnema kinseyi TaxID=2817044 RepID=UPI00143D9C15|nr:uncharacterized protein LOC117168943 [Belonocnema kinseyi]
MDIASMLEVQVNEVTDGKEIELKENVTPGATFSRASSPPLKPYSQTENDFFKMLYGADVPAVRFCRIHCTACDIHIGSAPSQITNMFEHPKLRTLLCLKCYEFYGDGDFEQGDDQTDMFCRWCANGGNLYCCSLCSNTFCAKCIKRNFDAVVAKKIEADENWKCFVCDETDLYPARSLCRAIIQHVQTVSRILQNDKSMTAAQIDEKMSLDEARCCVRKRKRKRRRTGSCSEDEDDETYNPVLSEIPQAKRRRTRKSGAFPSIHTNGSVNNTSDDESSLLGGDNDLLPAMLACEQTMTEGETALPFGPPPPPLQRVKPPPLVYTNNTKINPIPTANLLKPVQVRRLTPIGQLSQAPRPMLVHKRPNRPMVSIPQPKPHPKPSPQVPPQQKRARVHLPQSRSQNRSDTGFGAPKIIDLDSDSDEAIEVIAEASKSPEKSKTQQDKQDAELSEMRDKSFEQLILDQKQDIDLALQTLRKKFSTILSVSSDETQRNSRRNASLKMRQFQQVMRKAICRLAQINDRVVREYQSWKKHQPAERNANSERTKVDLLPTKNPDVDLEMKCIRDSASESEGEDEDKSEDTILEASNLEADQLNCYRNLTLFRKKVTFEQAVGDDKPFKEDKSVQADDVRTRDYEKSVGYSLLMKAEYDPKTNKDVLKPVAIPNDHFGKFQEQYIYHLQHIEDNGIKTDDDVDDLPDPNETPLKDLIEANSPFIAEMLENIAPTVTNGSSSVEIEMISDETPPVEKNISEEIFEDHHADPTVATCKAVEELVKMVTKLSDELKSSNNSPENDALSPAEITDKSEDTSKKEKTRMNDESKDEETVLAVRTLIEEESSSSNDVSEPPDAAQAVEDGCSFLN